MAHWAPASCKNSSRFLSHRAILAKCIFSFYVFPFIIPYRSFYYIIAAAIFMKYAG